jgi:dipeptidase
MIRSRLQTSVVCLAVGVAALVMGWGESTACTTIAVGKKASADGSTIVSHSNDAFEDQRITRIPARSYEPGAKENIYYAFQACDFIPELGGAPYRNYVGLDRGPVNDSGEKANVLLGAIPQVQRTYAYFDASYPFMNEHQLSIAGETTCRARVDDVMPLKGKRIFYSSSLARVALQRCKKAKEAVLLMGSLIDRYGYYGTGECLVAADTEEVWVIEMCGYSNDPGAGGGLWAARRLADDEVFVSANQFRIRDVKPDSPDMLYSEHLFEICQQLGWWHPAQGLLDWTATVGGGEYHHPYYSLRRVWRIFSRVKPSAGFTPDVKDQNTRAYPFSIRPDRKLSVRDVAALHRDHYEGTRFDLTQGIAAGPFGNPTRYEKTKDEKDAQPGKADGWFERPLSIYRCGYTVITQCRADYPAPIGGLVWIGYDKPSTCVFMPFFAGCTQFPESFSRGRYTEFDAESAWWTFNLVANYINLKYAYMIQDVERLRNTLESEAFEKTCQTQKQAMVQWRQGNQDAARLIVTRFGLDNSRQVLDAWRKLFGQLVVKYNNGDIIAPDGSIRKPGYPDHWLEKTNYKDGPITY